MSLAMASDKEARNTPMDSHPAGFEFDHDVGSSAREIRTPTRDKTRKRTRLTLACEECQIRKVKCDNRKPGTWCHRGLEEYKFGLLKHVIACSACTTRHGNHANCVYQSKRATAEFSRECVPVLRTQFCLVILKRVICLDM